jgi:hypothetical protein
MRGHHRGSEQGQVPSEDKFNESLPDKQEIDHHQMYPKYINKFADESDQHQAVRGSQRRSRSMAAQ